MAVVSFATLCDPNATRTVRLRLVPTSAGAETATGPVPIVKAPGAHDSQFRPIADELRELEITRMREALEATNNNQTRAAGLLTMPVRTFFEKAKLYGLTPKKK